MRPRLDESPTGRNDSMSKGQGLEFSFSSASHGLASLAIVLAFLLAGCSGAPTGSNTSSSFAPQTEKAFCSAASNYTGGISLAATARFQARTVTASGLGAGGALTPIVHAEVQVLNSAGATVQCGVTDANGQISLIMPKVAGTYTLAVNSRADNNLYKVSVLNNTTDNQFYSLTQSFSLLGTETSVSVNLPTAGISGGALGGAFNIMHQVFLANEFLRNNSLCASYGGICQQFTVAPRASIYWTLGFSPASYFGSPGTGLSFYAKSDDLSRGLLRGLYILGGIQGDSNCADTDHFDNSVILHEYGHFLEDVFAVSNSPGGAHDGNSIIDPRLAWSEGWANFLQSAIRGQAQYWDTIGNSSCSTGSTYLGVSLNLATPTAGQDRMLAGTSSGEGVFREVSVSRLLYDVISPTDVDAGFAIIWQVFSGVSSGLADPNVRFRNVGRFNEFLLGYLNTYNPAKAASFNTYVGNEYQLSNQSEYAQPLTLQVGGTCTRSITGAANVVSSGRNMSNLLRSNDFFAVYYNGSNFSSINLRYSGTGTPSDLDLYVYREDHEYGATSDIVVRSARFYPESGGTGQESVSFVGLPAGWYLLNIKVESAAVRNPATYYLETGSGARLCP